MNSRAIRQSDWIWLSLGVLHLGIVLERADRFLPRTPSPLNAFLHYYGEIAGARYSYGFYTPEVDELWRVRAELSIPGSRPSEDVHLEEVNPYRETQIRAEGVITTAVRTRHGDAFQATPFIRKFTNLAAEAALRKYPEARSVTVHLERFDLPQYGQSRPPRPMKKWLELYGVQASRQKFGPDP